MAYGHDDHVLITGVGFALAGVERAADLWTRHRDSPRTPYDPASRLGRRRLRYKDRATRLALAAVQEALDDSGLLVDGRLTVPGDGSGVVVSSNFGNVDAVCRAAETIARDTTAALSPMELPNTASNVIASWAAIRFGLRGAGLTLCNGPTSGLDAVFWAAALIRADRIERAVVVGVEPANEVVRRLLGSEPGAVPGSGGMRLLDGAVAVVLESARSARHRRCTVLAGWHGYARCAGLGEAVARARSTDGSPVGVWLVPDGRAWHGWVPPDLDGVHAHDLSENLGRCSGALGVLQCAAATAYLAEGGPGHVLATVGGSPEDDAAAAAVLTAPEGR